MYARLNFDLDTGKPTENIGSILKQNSATEGQFSIWVQCKDNLNIPFALTASNECSRVHEVVEIQKHGNEFSGKIKSNEHEYRITFNTQNVIVSIKKIDTKLDNANKRVAPALLTHNSSTIDLSGDVTNEVQPINPIVESHSTTEVQHKTPRHAVNPNTPVRYFFTDGTPVFKVLRHFSKHKTPHVDQISEDGTLRSGRVIEARGDYYNLCLANGEAIKAGTALIEDKTQLLMVGKDAKGNLKTFQVHNLDTYQASLKANNSSDQAAAEFRYLNDTSRVLSQDLAATITCRQRRYYVIENRDGKPFETEVIKSERLKNFICKDKTKKIPENCKLSREGEKLFVVDTNNVGEVDLQPVRHKQKRNKETRYYLLSNTEEKKKTLLNLLPDEEGRYFIMQKKKNHLDERVEVIPKNIFDRLCRADKTKIKPGVALERVDGRLMEVRNKNNVKVYNPLYLPNEQADVPSIVNTQSTRKRPAVENNEIIDLDHNTPINLHAATTAELNELDLQISYDSIDQFYNSPISTVPILDAQPNVQASQTIALPNTNSTTSDNDRRKRQKVTASQDDIAPTFNVKLCSVVELNHSIPANHAHNDTQPPVPQSVAPQPRNTHQVFPLPFLPVARQHNFFQPPMPFHTSSVRSPVPPQIPYYHTYPFYSVDNRVTLFNPAVANQSREVSNPSPEILSPGTNPYGFYSPINHLLVNISPQPGNTPPPENPSPRGQ